MKITMKLGLVAVLAVTGAALAADVGDPVFPVDLKDKTRAEIVYESFSRDLKDGDTKVRFEADNYFARIHTDVGPYASLDFDAGYFDPSKGDGSFIGGVGLRYLVYDATSYRISANAQGHYAPSTKYAGESANFWEVDGGLTLGGKIKIDEQLTIVPYAGPILSTANVDGDVVSLSENNVFGGVAGLSLELRQMNTIRVEARYFDAVSYSVAAGIAF